MLPREQNLIMKAPWQNAIVTANVATKRKTLSHICIVTNGHYSCRYWHKCDKLLGIEERCFTLNALFNESKHSLCVKFMTGCIALCLAIPRAGNVGHRFWSRKIYLDLYLSSQYLICVILQTYLAQLTQKIYSFHMYWSCSSICVLIFFLRTLIFFQSLSRLSAPSIVDDKSR